MIQERNRKIAEYIYRLSEAVPSLIAILNDPSEARQLEGIKLILEVARQDQERGPACFEFFQSLVDAGLINCLVAKIIAASPNLIAILAAELFTEISFFFTIKLQEFLAQHLELVEQLIKCLASIDHNGIGCSIFASLVVLMNTTDKVPYSPLWEFTITHLIKGLDAGFYHQYKPFCLELLIAFIPIHAAIFKQIMSKKLLNKAGTILLDGPKYVKLGALRLVKAIIALGDQSMNELIKSSHILRTIMEVVSRIRKYGMFLEIFRAMIKMLIDKNETALLANLVEEGKDVTINFELLPELKPIWNKYTAKKTLSGKRPVHEGMRRKELNNCGLEELRIEGNKRVKCEKIMSEVNI